MLITTTAAYPFEKISLDIWGPYPVSNDNNKYMLTFIDDLTKFAGAIEIPNQEAKTIARAFNEIIPRCGIPESVLTDQGTNLKRLSNC